MSKSLPPRSSSQTVDSPVGPIVVNVMTPGAAPWRLRLLSALLLASLLLNVAFWARSLMRVRSAVPEFHHSGVTGAAERIAIIPIEGLITPPFTERWIRQIEQAREDDSVRGVVLHVDSPGGFVADSDHLYQAVRELSEAKPVHVAMKRLAASGGYYLAMGIGPGGTIWAEPTTWTGSIGVIIPRYNAARLAEEIGVEVDPLVTGPFKDSLNPFRDMSNEEQQVWDAILEDAFDRFVSVIVSGRGELDEPAVRELATGQIYTAEQARTNQLVDEIGDLDDAVASLAAELNLQDYEAIEYRSTPGLIDLMLGVRSDPAPSIYESLLDSTVPRAMYYCSWSPWVPVPAGSH